MSTSVHIGSGAGFAGDRFDAAVPVVATLAKRDGPKYLIYEVLAERTLAFAQGQKRRDPTKGYSPYLDRYLPLILADAKRHGVRIVTNMGAANVEGAARRVLERASELGISGLRVAVVEGDDLRAVFSDDEIREMDTMEGLEIGARPILAANAYLGARPVAAALALGADVVLVGRTTDAALVLGPLIHEFGWAETDWDRLAAGVVAGHLLECGAQVTGAYFADPGFKDVPRLSEVGFPIAEVREDGAILLGKAEGTGGLVSCATVTEQILYEVHDPSAYLTPDVSTDITGVTLEQVGPDLVSVTGARGKARPETLKATVSLRAGWLGEGEMTYAGPNALARAELAADVVRDRCRMIGVDAPLRIDLIGTGATHDGDQSRRRKLNHPVDGEYRLRAAVRSTDKAVAQMVVDEVLSLYCSGPAGGGGARQMVTPSVATASVLVDRRQVEAAQLARIVE